MAKILCVDDAAFMLSMLKNILYKNNYMDLYTASDGIKAIEKYKEIHPDLVLMDVYMPNMDGLEALNVIMSYDCNANVVMCVSKEQSGWVAEAIRRGAKGIIVKPYCPDDIVKIVSKIIG